MNDYKTISSKYELRTESELEESQKRQTEGFK